jgi:hypothetical protein
VSMVLPSSARSSLQSELVTSAMVGLFVQFSHPFFIGTCLVFTDSSMTSHLTEEEEEEEQAGSF